MARSLKKGPFIDDHFQAKIDKALKIMIKNLSKHGQGDLLSHLI